MIIKLHDSTYTGVAGSSLSDARCEQTLDLYYFIISHPDMSYRDVRSETVKDGLYRSESVLRTFCPLLRELGFIVTEQNAPMSFTPDGELFVHILSSIKQAEEIEDENTKKSLLRLLESAKCHAIQLGILNMNNSDDETCRNHNIWLVLYLLDNLDYFDWNEYWLALKVFIEDHSNLIDFRSQIDNNRRKGVTYEAKNFDNLQVLADTTYTYIRALLKEANIIENNTIGSKLTSEGKSFIKKITLWNQ